jgi:hypothetical protein
LVYQYVDNSRIMHFSILSKYYNLSKTNQWTPPCTHRVHWWSSQMWCTDRSSASQPAGDASDWRLPQIGLRPRRTPSHSRNAPAPLTLRLSGDPLFDWKCLYVKLQFQFISLKLIILNISFFTTLIDCFSTFSNNCAYIRFTNSKSITISRSWINLDP